MKLNRRNFLKVCSLTVGAIAINPVAVIGRLGLVEPKSVPDFNPRLQYGDYVLIHPSDWDAETLEETHDLLMDQILESIPSRWISRDTISFIHQRPAPMSCDPYSLVGTVGWKYTPQ